MKAEAPPDAPAGRARARTSLFARALFFLAVGGGSLLGAVAVLSAVMADEAEERLLTERVNVARTVGALIEQHLLSDLRSFAAWVAPALRRGDPPEAMRQPLARQYRATVFDEGAFVLGEEGETLASVPGPLEPVRGAFDFDGLLAAAREAKRPVVSGLVLVSEGRRALLVLLSPVVDPAGGVRGFVGGLLQPATSNLLMGAAPVGVGAFAGVRLFEENGQVVASSAPGDLFPAGDHGRTLAEAIRSRRSLEGRCHSCHDGEEPTDEVLAFAPMPTLAMGVAIMQPEAYALAPAFSLRSRLTKLVAVVVVFLVFAGLSVRAVVRPVTRLTEAVRGLRGTSGPEPLPRFGRDEVGELAGAIEQMRGRMLALVAIAEEHQRALSVEAAATRSHLETLEHLAALGVEGASAEEVVRHGLLLTVETMGLDAGVMCLLHASQPTVPASVTGSAIPSS